MSKSDTPNLDKVYKYARDNKNKKLQDALKKLYEFVGANELKESFATSVQYFIVTNTPVNVRRSKRRKVVRKKSVKNEAVQESECECSGEESELDGEELKDTLFRLMLADKLKDMLGREDDSSDEDYDPEEFTNNKRKRAPTQTKKLKKLHTCLLGQPGVGKTMFAQIMVDVWSALGIVDKNKFFITGRGDWVAKYHGHSSQKAKKLIRKAKGGCIFIDEAYALIGSNSDDMFGSEVLTAIVEAMTSPEKDVVFIMAGYKDKMERVFRNNSGLERRFSYIFEFPKPTVRQIVDIFKTQVKRSKWKLKCKNEDLFQFFQQHVREFSHAGGSTEKFLDYCQHSAVTRNFPNSPSQNIKKEDLLRAMTSMRNVNKKISAMSDPPATMYI